MCLFCHLATMPPASPAGPRHALVIRGGGACSICCREPQGRAVAGARCALGACISPCRLRLRQRLADTRWRGTVACGFGGYSPPPSSLFFCRPMQHGQSMNKCALQRWTAVTKSWPRYAGAADAWPATRAVLACCPRASARPLSRMLCLAIRSATADFWQSLGRRVCGWVG